MLAQLLERHQSQLHGIVRVVRVVSHAVGCFDNLYFQERRDAPRGEGRPLVGPRRLAVEHLPREIQPRKRRIARFQFLGDRQGIPIVRKAAVLTQALVERVLAGMAIGRVADIVKQGQGLDQVLIEPQGPADGARDRGDLVGVRKPRAVVVAHVAGEDLHLAAQAAKGRRMDNPVAVALVGPAIGVLGLRMLAATRGGARLRVAGEQGRFALGGGLRQGKGTGRHRL